VEIGFRSGRSDAGGEAVRWESGHGRERSIVARVDDEGLMMTADGQLVELTATAFYRIGNERDELRAFAYATADPETALRALAECAVREVVSRTVLDDLLTSGRSRAQQDAARSLQRRVGEYGFGIAIAEVAFQDVHPPLAVVDSYRDVTRAESERQKRINEAATYRAERLALGAGQAAVARERAQAESEARKARAAGAADAFLALEQARAGFPALADRRLYEETLAQALAGKSKIVLEPGKADRRLLWISDLPTGSSVPELKAALPSLGRPEAPKEEKRK
jgi:regulator of protease activity HflC (stomatin/prohibitin superfamily)